MVVGTGLRGEHGLDGPEVTRVGVHERRPACKLFDEREELTTPPLHPPDGEELREVPRVGVGVAHFGAQPVTLGRGVFGFAKPA